MAANLCQLIFLAVCRKVQSTRFYVVVEVIRTVQVSENKEFDSLIPRNQEFNKYLNINYNSEQTLLMTSKLRKYII